MTLLERIQHVLQERGTPMGNADIASALCVNASRLDYPIHTGIKEGVLFSQRDPHNGRCNLYSLTPMPLPDTRYRDCKTCGKQFPLTADYFYVSTRTGNLGLRCKACVRAKKNMLQRREAIAKREGTPEPRVEEVAPGYIRVRLVDQPLKRTEPFRPRCPVRGGQSSLENIYG